MMRMLRVTTGMYAAFVAPSLTFRRCPCVTSVSCNVVRIALVHIHMTVWRCFTSAIFFGVRTLKSSAIKANSAHRRLGLEVMYSKGCLATGYDAGKAILHKGESNGGAPLCVLRVYCIFHAGGGACHGQLCHVVHTNCSF